MLTAPNTPSNESWPGRLLVEDQPRPGNWNMAYDAALLNGSLARDEAILRIYRWSEPTLSLGHFQKKLPDDLPDSLRRLPRVRRLSGGGAILHHHEWTYSCAVPPGHPLAKRGTILYEVVHAALIESLRQLGVNARMRGTTTDEHPFLCFLRSDARDILVGENKIVGSAQRRRRGAVLQHGSLLLRTSSLSPRVPGLFDLADIPQESEMFACEGFVRELSRRLFTDPPDRSPHRDDVAALKKILESAATSGPRDDEQTQ